MTNLDRLQATKTLYCQLLPCVSLAAANPTQATIDAALAAVETASYSGQLALKPSTSMDGEQYDWVGYAQDLRKGIAELNDLIRMEGFPWIARSRARP